MNSELRKGATLLVLCLLAIPLTGYTMDDWDRSEKEYDRECDLVFRILYLGLTEPIDPIACEDLKDEKQSKLRIFIVSLSIFVGSGVGGLVLILPYGESNPPIPPPGGQLR
tara:strand:+ start:566 stop:898 length:333 start_codon:yes stop_codon:yes gene_type:complete